VASLAVEGACAADGEVAAGIEPSAGAQPRIGTPSAAKAKRWRPAADAKTMDRPAVIGVPRRTLPAAAAAPSRGRSFEQAQVLAGAIALVLAGVRWLCVGTPFFELLLLVPFWFAATPVLAWAGGLGVAYWSQEDREFLAIDAAAQPLLAKMVLIAEMVASVGFAVALFVVQIRGGGGGG
jgi:hypothetical protein